MLPVCVCEHRHFPPSLFYLVLVNSIEGGSVGKVRLKIEHKNLRRAFMENHIDRIQKGD